MFYCKTLKKQMFVILEMLNMKTVFHGTHSQMAKYCKLPYHFL